MDEKTSDNHVAELLKQLEELKKIKARKEKKLMKLKSNSFKDSSNMRCSDASSTTSGRKHNSRLLNSAIDEGHTTKNHVKNDNLPCNKLNKSNEFHKSACPKNSERNNQTEKTEKNNECKTSIKLTNVHKFENSIKESNFESNINEANDRVIFGTEIFHHEAIMHTDKNVGKSAISNEIASNNQTILNREVISQKKNSNEFLLNKSSFSKSKSPVLNDTSLNNETIIHTDKNAVKSTLSSEIASKNQIFIINREIAPHKKSWNELLLNKSSLLRSESPELIDDSLNSNMSCFMLVDGNGQQKVLENDNSNVCESIENKFLKQTAAEKIDSDLKISLPFSLELSSHEFQHADGVFNFPKFSTPSDVNIYQSSYAKNKLNNLLDKSETQKTSLSENDLLNNIGKDDMLNNIGNNKTFITEDSSVENIPKINCDENKMNPPLLNCILGSGLSSMLDACYESPVKGATPVCLNFPNLVSDDKHSYSQDIKNVSKKRKFLNDYNSSCSEENSNMLNSSVPLSAPICNELSENKKVVPYHGSSVESKDNLQCNLDDQISKSEYQAMEDELDFDNSILYSNPFTDSQNAISSKSSSSNEVLSQVTKAVDGLIAKVCENMSNHNGLPEFSSLEPKENNYNENITFDSEVLIIPETEGLGLYFSKDTEDFLETSTLSQSFRHFETNNLLNTSSQSKLDSPVVNNIVSALRTSEGHSKNENLYDTGCNRKESLTKDGPPSPKCGSPIKYEASCSTTSRNNVAMDTSFLEDDTQELGKLVQVPYMTDENVQENSIPDKFEKKDESTLTFSCSLHGAVNEPVLDAEIVLFNNVKYAFLQHRTEIHVWRQEKAQWVKIFHHSIEEMLSLDKMCISRDVDNLVIVMLLSGNGKCCLQFLLFEKDVRVIKLMENTHWLEERPSKEKVLLCSLDGLMFATAQCNVGHEVSLHAFISLKENPRLMTAVLGSTDSELCSLCKIDKLPNALMGINDSMLYIWHVLEARLVTAVTLHPHDYLPIKKCFWATVEKGLIYFMTTCEGAKDFQVCQLLAANLATGFCQNAMTYTTLPSKTKSKISRITKAAYLEPFLVIGHSHGALLWTVTEEFCCAALSTQSEVTTVTISKDIENWGLLAIGNTFGCINCYSLN